MTNNLKTWPEKIHLQYLVDQFDNEVITYAEASNHETEIKWSEHRINECDVEYIRADIAGKLEKDAFQKGLAFNGMAGCITIEEAKEREAKLIRAAINYPDSLSEIVAFEDGAKLLYDKSRLEEL